MKQAAALAVPYGPKHPKRIAIDNQLKDLQQKIDEEGARIGSALSNDVAVARAQLGSLQGSFATTQHKASGQDMTAVKLRALEAEADSSRKLYDAFLNRLTTIQDQEGLQYPDAHVISRAAVPAAPSSPQRSLIVVASIPIGLLAGCLAALVAMRFGGPVPAAARVAPPRPVPVRAPAPAPAYQGPPLLAEIPGALAEGAADHVVDWPASPFARAVGALVARVMPDRNSGAGRVIAVTSSESPAAATTVALALGRAAAAKGLRTVLVEGHLVRPVLADAARIRPQAGLLEVLAGAVPLNRALAHDPKSEALLLALPRLPKDPKAALASPRMGELFAHLRGICDLAIVAAPPVLASSETPSLARLADAVVVVAHPDERPRPGLSQAIAALGQWRSAPVGMVLVR
jgi:Mrp family chromosome partitioning ATPase